MAVLEYDIIIMRVTKSVRTFLGHSTGELASLLKLDETYYKQIENSEVSVSVGQLWEIANKMGFSVVFLFAIADAHIKFNFKETSITELEAKLDEIWTVSTKEIPNNTEGYAFFKTNLRQIIIQIKKHYT